MPSQRSPPELLFGKNSSSKEGVCVLQYNEKENHTDFSHNNSTKEIGNHCYHSNDQWPDQSKLPYYAWVANVMPNQTEQNEPQFNIIGQEFATKEECNKMATKYAMWCVPLIQTSLWISSIQWKRKPEVLKPQQFYIHNRERLLQPPSSF